MSEIKITYLLREIFQQQKMADLPRDRKSEEALFMFCGSDMLGPFVVKNGLGLSTPFFLVEKLFLLSFIYLFMKLTPTPRVPIGNCTLLLHDLGLFIPLVLIGN